MPTIIIITACEPQVKQGSTLSTIFLSTQHLWATGQNTFNLCPSFLSSQQLQCFRANILKPATDQSKSRSKFGKLFIIRRLQNQDLTILPINSKKFSYHICSCNQSTISTTNDHPSTNYNQHQQPQYQHSVHPSASVTLPEHNYKTQ